MFSKGKPSVYDNREYITEYGYAVMNSMKSFSEEMRKRIDEKRKNAHDYALAYDNDPQVQLDVERACYPEREYDERQMEIVNRTILCMLFTYYDNTLLFLAKQHGVDIPKGKSHRDIFNPLIESGIFPVSRDDYMFICNLLRYMRNVIIHGEKREKEEQRANECIKKLSLNIIIEDAKITGIDLTFLQNAMERIIRVLIVIDDSLIMLKNNDCQERKAGKSTELCQACCAPRRVLLGDKP